MHTLRLPRVHGPATAPTGQGNACGLTPLAQLYGDAWMQAIGTYARGKTCHPLCTEAAQVQANFLAVNDFVKGDAHRGEGGSYANQRLARTGFRVPSWWTLEENFVESAQHAWRGENESDSEFATRAAARLVNHATHREHMSFDGWWKKWGFSFYGVGAAKAVFDTESYFLVAVTAPSE